MWLFLIYVTCLSAKQVLSYERMFYADKKGYGEAAKVEVDYREHA